MPGTLLAWSPVPALEIARFGRLARLAELLHARRPPAPAVLAPCDGRIEFTTNDEFGRFKRLLHPLDARGAPTGEPLVLRIPPDRYFRFGHGELVRAGELLVEGDLDPRELLQIKGFESLHEYLLAELADCFRRQTPAIEIDQRHFELLLAQMLSLVRIEAPGDSGLLPGKPVERSRVEAINCRLRDSVKIEEQRDGRFQRGEIMPRDEFDVECKSLLGRGQLPPEACAPWLAGYRRLILGIRAVAERRNRFLAVRGHHPTRRSLVRAALGASAPIYPTMKQSVALGQLIPAGDPSRAEPQRRELLV
jgi:DNA-directed RNA polymerase subunit beta'